MNSQYNTAFAPLTSQGHTGTLSHIARLQLQGFSINRSGAGLRICYSNKFLGDAEAAILRTTAPRKIEGIHEKNSKWMLGGQKQ